MKRSTAILRQALKRLPKVSRAEMDPVCQAISVLIRKAFAESGLSLKEITAATGFSTREVREVLNGERFASFDLSVRLLRALGFKLVVQPL